MIARMIANMIADLIASLLERLGYYPAFELERLRAHIDGNLRTLQTKDEKIEELRQQLEQAESQARQAESQLFNANAKLDKQLEILTDVRGQLASEQHARHQAEKALSEQLSRAQSAIDTLQGKC